MMTIQAILLCAGRGTRFDATGNSSKLLAPLSTGVLVLEAALNHLMAVDLHPLAIANPSQEQVKSFLTQQAISWVESPQADQGMGFSIATGVRHSEDVDGWLICLGDMPYIKQETLAQLLKAIEQYPQSIVAPVYQGKRGHPVFIPKIFKEDLLDLQKDEGPRHLMKHGPVVLMDTNDAGILRDIDQPSDLI
jgi:molybdenum cofactor cytidylyltransferase